MTHAYFIENPSCRKSQIKCYSCPLPLTTLRPLSPIFSQWCMPDNIGHLASPGLKIKPYFLCCTISPSFYPFHLFCINYAYLFTGTPPFDGPQLKLYVFPISFPSFHPCPLVWINDACLFHWKNLLLEMPNQMLLPPPRFFPPPTPSSLWDQPYMPFLLETFFVSVLHRLLL